VIRVWQDTETFGLDPKINPVATVYMALYDENDKFIDDINLKVKPDSMEGMVVDHETEKIHGINWDKHVGDPNTILYSEANKRITDFLIKYKIPKAKKSFKPCGQNVVFDINYLRNTIFTLEEWDKLFHYRYTDTLAVLGYLQDVNLVPGDLGNLGSLVEYFDIKSGGFHDARNDVKMTVEVYKKMKGLILGLKSANMIAGSNIDLLKVVED
jgi:oligoribonuclease (3'-5' exoribonuclease)